MNVKDTLQRLQEIEARLDKATKGKWKRHRSASTAVVAVDVPDPMVTEQLVASCAGLQSNVRADRCHEEGEANTDLIVNSRADLEWACAQLRVTMRALRMVCEEHSHGGYCPVERGATDVAMPCDEDADNCHDQHAECCELYWLAKAMENPE